MTSTVGLIAWREITVRAQQRGFRIGFALTVLVAAIGCALPGLLGGGDSPAHYRIGLATTDGAAARADLSQALAEAGRTAGAEVTTRTVSAADARTEVRAGRLSAAILPGGVLLVRSSGAAVVPVVQSADQLVTVTHRLRTAGLTQSQISEALDAPGLRVQATAPNGNSQRQALSTIAVIVLFSQLISFCAWVATGVVEEKSSRVVELVLAAVTPRQLLTGKLLGIGVLAIAQVLALGVSALVSATLSGTLHDPGAAFVTVLVAFVGFLLAFALFASLSAALGSTVSRQEEVSAVLTPVSLTLTACYAASFVAISAAGSTTAVVLSVVPPFSALAMPARIARGTVPVAQIGLAVVLLLALTVVITVVAARIYRASILHSGTRVSLRQAWRGDPAAHR